MFTPRLVTPRRTYRLETGLGMCSEVGEINTSFLQPRCHGEYYINRG